MENKLSDYPSGVVEPKWEIMDLRGQLCTGIVLLSWLTGCRSFFEPPAASFERWTRPGAASHQVMASLMECGYPSPSATVNEWISADGTIWQASRLQAARCMEGQGFTEKFGEGSQGECKYYSFAETRKYFNAEQLEALDRACVPKSPVRQPSVEKRLNSPYCKNKTYSAYPQCHPIVPPDVKLETRAASRFERVPEYPVPNELTHKVQEDGIEQMNKMRQSMQKQK